MVDSGTVNGDASKASSLFSNYSSEISNLSGNVWQGESKDAAMTSMKNFASEYQPKIANQMKDFASAVDKYKDYKQAKDDLKQAESDLSRAEAAAANQNPKPDLSSYRNKITDLKNKMQKLKGEITSTLSTVSSAKIPLKTSTISVDTGSYTIGDFVYYNQGWYKNAYGSHGTISSSGCGPTSMAMVLSTLTGKKITPVEAAKYSVQHGYRGSNGTSWGFFPSAAKAYGINCQNVSYSASNINKYLGEGKLLICSMKPGHFTKGGHFIVLQKLENGKVRVADPNKHSGLWDASLIARECKQMWAFDGGNSKSQTKNVTF